ncbi:MAG: Hsp70 family protein [Deltaproteobacteria bacterium]|jgi:molecular chaperone DnaK|nr:Hsp70 family protein [Deltaproteobacteria bacterium]
MIDVLGIDLGTAWSKAAVLENGKPKLINLRGGDAAMSSSVWVERVGDLVAGERAAALEKEDEYREISMAKLFVGRNIDSIEAKTTFIAKLNAVKLSRFAVKNGWPVAAFSYGEAAYSLVESLAATIGEIARLAERTAARGHLKKVIIAVPSLFDMVQRESVLQAATIAGLQNTRLISAPLAAALGSGLDPNDRRTIAVIDIGAGFTDVAVIETGGGIVNVRGYGGDASLGGIDFDAAVADFLIEKFGEPDGGKEERLLMASARKAKEELSALAATEVRRLYHARDAGPEQFVILERTRLEDLTRGLTERIINAVDGALNNAGVKKEEISRALLLGGMSKTPRIRQAIENFFGATPQDATAPEGLVAMGAARNYNPVRYSNAKSVEDESLYKVKENTLYSLGLQTADCEFLEFVGARDASAPYERKLCYPILEARHEIVALFAQRSVMDNSIRIINFCKIDNSCTVPRWASAFNLSIYAECMGSGVLYIKEIENHDNELKVRPTTDLSDFEVERLAIEYARRRLEKDKNEILSEIVSRIDDLADKTRNLTDTRPTPRSVATENIEPGRDEWLSAIGGLNALADRAKTLINPKITDDFYYPEFDKLLYHNYKYPRQYCDAPSNQKKVLEKAMRPSILTLLSRTKARLPDNAPTPNVSPRRGLLSFLKSFLGRSRR